MNVFRPVSDKYPVIPLTLFLGMSQGLTFRGCSSWKVKLEVVSTNCPKNKWNK